MIKHLLMTLSSTASHCGRCLVGCVILSSALASPALAEDCVKTFRWTEDPPYTYASADAPGGVSGISADIVRTVLSDLGCDVRFVDMPWARALSALQTGRVDIVSGAFDTPERRAYAHYANQGDTSPNVIFVRADSPGAVAWQQFSDLLDSDITLGGQIGVNYGPEYQQALANGSLEGRLTLVPNRPLLWQMLDRDRIDAVAASYLTGLMEISQLGFRDRIVSTGIELSSDPAYIIFSKASVDETFVDRFNEVHTTLLQSEKYQAIVDAHTREVQVSE
ncbi:substrate-binding periplasmic protein [Saccharospirillum alexandrii]|uniref:substrate-binding periplasmic protein n=1 Tax=Saccharospirillum alexandrii TaxID=2448477 RepID=UPI000FD7E22F|nr:transporter substrate-binding domain-containing protein [Saccharospirillum alexandrii]